MLSHARFLISFFFVITIGIATGAPAAEPARTETIVAFKNADVLKRIGTNEGVSISLAPDGALLVRITPFEQHKNNWPVVAFDARYFEKPLNLAAFSRIEAVLHHDTPGMSLIDLNLSSVADVSSGVDYEQCLVPGHSPVTVKMDLTALKNHDASEVAVLQFIFRPRPTETVYRIESIRAVYDPAIGSPTDALEKKLAAVKQQFSALEDLPATLPQAQQQGARGQLTGLGERLSQLSRDVAEARKQQYYKSLRRLLKQADGIANDVGRMRFLADGPLLLWQPDRYQNVLPETGPDLETVLLKDVALKMAGNEFRDVVVSATAFGGDLSVDIGVRPKSSGAFPPGAVEIHVNDSPKNLRGEYTADALLPVEGPVSIPAGQTRQFWIRFNTRTVAIAPGRHDFEILFNAGAGINRSIPGSLEVWNFSLPGYDVLPNNSYAIFSNGVRSDATGDLFRQAIADMKLHGFNHIFVEPPEIPVPIGLDDQWQITGYNDKAFRTRIKAAADAWNQAAGDGKLHFIIALSNFEDLGLKREGYAFPNEKWKSVLTQYINHLKSLISEAGIASDQWMLVLRDESMEPVLAQYDIPFAEAIKSIDPSIRIKCNSSAILSDAALAQRYFKAFDLFQPHRGRTEVVKFLRGGGKPIWFYECDTGLTALGRDLYDYYRLYTWEMLEQGIVGTGVWTYYSSNHDRPWNEDFQGCQMIYIHPQRGLIHTRRYEMFREGADDWRYVTALRDIAATKGSNAKTQADALIADATKNILAHRQDRQRCEAWRQRIAQRIVELKAVN